MNPNQLRRIRTTADFCFDRDSFADGLVSSAFQSGAGLLFGARQSGKTTLLRYMAKKFAPIGLAAGEINDVDLHVYVDLMQLPYDASPGDFFQLLSSLALSACRSCLPEYGEVSFAAAPDGGDVLFTFANNLRAVFAAGGETRVRFLFLLDESKRILGDRFPRGFQDNLFAILYGDDLGLCDRVAMIFAGAQDLYSFCEDDTSPIGTRASFHMLGNLSAVGISSLLAGAGVELPEGESSAIVNLIHEYTGGHAGLTARYAEQLAMCNLPIDEKSVRSAADHVYSRCGELLRLWTVALSKEARTVQPLFANQRQLCTGDVAHMLHAGGFDRFLADRVFQEWKFTGIARIEGSQAFLVNEIYWKYFRSISREGAETRPEVKAGEKSDVLGDPTADQLIEGGEVTRTEFKSTLRVNLHTNVQDKKMEHSCLKTIAAFLNSQGGHLIIGVSDTGDVLGIENDGFPNEDKMNLHLVNLLKDRLGAGHILHIEHRFESSDNKRVLVVRCKPSGLPVYLKDGNSEQFFVRTGAATTELKASEIHPYIQQRFQKKS